MSYYMASSASGQDEPNRLRLGPIKHAKKNLRGITLVRGPTQAIAET